MKKTIIIGIFILLAIAAFWFYNKSKQSSGVNSVNNQQTNTVPMKISSPAFKDNDAVPVKYSCDGDGVNPPLEFSNVPSETASLALIVEDPDAPNGTWIHWIMWNISPQTNSIAENSFPKEAVQGQGSNGQNVYGSLCPPSGVHHYIFNLYALDQKLTIPSYSNIDNLTTAMQGHILAQDRIIGLYGKVQ